MYISITFNAYQNIVAKFLNGYRALINLQDNSRVSTIMHTNNNDEVIDLFTMNNIHLKYYANVVNMTSVRFNLNTNTKIVKLLIDNGADINMRNNFGMTPLMYACTKSDTTSNIETIKLLIDNKADINKCDIVGSTPLMYACTNYNTIINIEIIKLLIDNKADINTRNMNEIASLMRTCRYSGITRNIETIKLLIDNGADINIRNDFDHSPLVISCINSNTCNVETPKSLFNADAYLDLRNIKNYRII